MHCPAWDDAFVSSLTLFLVSCICYIYEQVAENRRQIRYTPNVLVVIPGRPNIQFDGTVIYTKGTQAQINVALRNAFRDPVTVQGKLDKQRNKNDDVAQ